MFAVAVEFVIIAGKESAFREAVQLQAHNSLTKEPACHQFDVCVTSEDPRKFFLYELYDDAEAFRVHRETPHFAEFQGKVGPLIESKRLLTWDVLKPIAS